MAAQNAPVRLHLTTHVISRIATIPSKITAMTSRFVLF